MTVRAAAAPTEPVGAAIVWPVRLQSHQFAIQRVVAALLTHDPDPARSPFRRTAAATLAGVSLAVVGLAGAAVYGLFTGPHLDNWRDETAIFLAEDSGATYVYQRSDDRLHPVPNYTSALLVVDSPAAHLVLTAGQALDGAPLGGDLGIPAAPSSLPSRDGLRTGPWTLCSGTDGRSTLLVGMPVGGGHPLAVPSAGTTGEALVLSTVDGDEYLVHDGKRHRIAHPETALAALGWSGRPPVRVAPALVNALPAGPDLAPVRVVGRGGPSGAAPGAKVGQLYTTGGHEYAVALADGAYDLTEVQAALLLADPAASGAPAIPLSTARYGALHRGTGGLGAPDGLPATPPTLVSPTGTVCATDRTVLLDPVLPDDADAPVGEDARVDRVLVRRGSGALVEAAPSPGAPPGSGTLSLVTDHGTRYPLPGPDLLAVLGYGGVTPVRVPADLVSLLPAGPALDPAAARSPLQGR